MMTMKHKVVVFDLDDTLYKEIDFLRSAYREIADHIQEQYGVENQFDRMTGWYEEGKDVFQQVIDYCHLPVKKDIFIKMYKEHRPDIKLDEETNTVLERLTQRSDCTLGIITDGRVLSQMNKIRALGLLQYMEEDNILISEAHGHQKPDAYAFRMIEHLHGNCDYLYVGDNPNKDFLAPNQLGWRTFCLKDNGRNIHKQNYSLSKEYLPKYIINTIQNIVL